MKKYKVLIDMQWSREYTITAINKKHAKLKAWIRFTRKVPMKIFRFYIDKIDEL